MPIADYPSPRWHDRAWIHDPYRRDPSRELFPVEVATWEEAERALDHYLNRPVPIGFQVLIDVDDIRVKHMSLVIHYILCRTEGGWSRHVALHGPGDYPFVVYDEIAVDRVPALLYFLP
jgi:hypothetical protein